MKRITKVLFCLLVSYIILERIPVKRCISAEEAYKKMNTDSNAHVCEFEATTGADWIIYTKNGATSRLVCLEGNVPINYINKASFFWFARNKFLIQGEVIGMRVVNGEGDIEDYYDIEEYNERIQAMESRCECYDIIDVTEWDVIGPLKRGNSFRFLAPKDALSLFDYIG